MWHSQVLTCLNLSQSVFQAYYPPQQQPVDQREYSIRELVESEKRYIEALGMIKTKFIRPLTAVGLLKEEEKKSIFFGIEVFYHQTIQECNI